MEGQLIIYFAKVKVTKCGQNEMVHMGRLVKLNKI